MQFTANAMIFSLINKYVLSQQNNNNVISVILRKNTGQKGNKKWGWDNLP